MDLKVFKADGSDDGVVSVPDGALEVTPRRDVLHQVVVWQQNQRRAHTAHTKTRAEIRGGGRKPWRQKGTGRARAGSRRSPIWRGGGTVHGPRTKEARPRLNKKVRRLGLRMALADRATNDALKVVRGLGWEQPSAKDADRVVRELGGRRTLVVLGDGRPAAGQPSVLERSFRNLSTAKVLQVEGLNVYDLLAHDTILVDESALGALYSRLGFGEGAAA